MFKSLKSLFGTPAAKPPVVPEVLNLTIGRAAEVDPLMLKLRDADSLFALPSPTLIFTAQGLCQLEDGSWVHRLYTDDNVMLQFVAGDREDDDSISDASLFVPFRSLYPSDDGALQAWADRLRTPTLTLSRAEAETADDLVFGRLWYEGSQADQDPVVLVENVYDDREQATPPRRIVQTCMLYRRPVGADADLLLAIIEQHASDTSVELMVGIPLDRHHLKM